MLLPIGSTPATLPPRPEHSAPTITGLSVLPSGGAAYTPKTGKAAPVFMAGQFPPLLTLLPEPVYQRRLFGLKPSTSIPEVFGQKVNTLPSVRRMASAPLIVGVTQATRMVFVTGSISLPCGP